MGNVNTVMCDSFQALYIRCVILLTCCSVIILKALFTCTCMRHGQKVSGMILLHSLSRYIKRDQVRIMSVHVSTSAECGFSSSVSCVKYVVEIGDLHSYCMSDNE